MPERPKPKVLIPQIGSRILGQEPAELFDPVGMCVMEQFDKATFAKVPLVRKSRRTLGA